MKMAAEAPAKVAGRQMRHIFGDEMDEEDLSGIELPLVEDRWAEDVDIHQADDDESDEDIESEGISAVLGVVKPSDRLKKPTMPRKEDTVYPVKPEDEIDRMQRDIDEVKQVMSNSIDSALERSERLNELVDKSDNLQLQAASFHKKAKTLKRQMFCSRCLRCMAVCVCGCPVATGHFLYEKMKNMFSKKSLFDNVLADTENAFQTLAKCLAYLQDAASCEFSLLRKNLCGYWVRLLCNVVSFVLVLSSTITLILPSFFTLLIVRTGTVEKESKAFGIRQEVIRVEKKDESLVRWIRIILRYST